MKMTDEVERLEDAALEYIDRNSGHKLPPGVIDRHGRFFMADSEKRECCAAIPIPTTESPYSELRHCQTAGHIARLFGVDEWDLRRLAWQMKRPVR